MQALGWVPFCAQISGVAQRQVSVLHASPSLSGATQMKLEGEHRLSPLQGPAAPPEVLQDCPSSPGAAHLPPKAQ
jgi:hypothetical protein